MGASRIGVAGGTAVWRRGIGAVLAEAGHTPVELADPGAWRPGRGGTAVLIHIDDAAGLDDLAALHDEHPHLPIVVSLPALGVSEFAAVVKAGARAAIDEEEPVEVLVAVLEHAIQGRASAPPKIMEALAARIRTGFGEALQVSELEAGLLRQLARGTTVSKLAETCGYSEREMFRLLSDLYTRIGTKSRTEAILWAERYGVLDDDDDE